jgi:hypothetical protein
VGSDKPAICPPIPIGDGLGRRVSLQVIGAYLLCCSKIAQGSGTTNTKVVTISAVTKCFLISHTSINQAKGPDTETPRRSNT